MNAVAASGSKPALIPILKYPDPILKRKAKPVTEAEFKAGKAGNWVLTDLVARMRVTMADAQGLGLAATQVGVELRLFTLAEHEGLPQGLDVFNPVLTDMEGELFEEEGCLSLPEIRGKVKRAQRLVLNGSSVTGAPFRMPLSDLLARACQHEIDHLNGVLFIRHLGSASRFMLRNKLQALEDEYTFRQRRHAHAVS